VKELEYANLELQGRMKKLEDMMQSVNLATGTRGNSDWL
jgi:hypothetical protein